MSRTRRSLACFALVSITGCFPSEAEDLPSTSVSAPAVNETSWKLEMKPSSELAGGGVQPKVIGASPANPGSWPSTLTFRTPDGGCTATAVGERVVLTAAHCVSDGQVGVLPGAITVTCAHHPEYPERISADFALCLADKPLPFGPYERVDTDPARVAVGATATLLGYGCIREGGIDRSFGTLYQGTAPIASVHVDDFYTVTRGGAAVCFGDSGGAAYLPPGSAGGTRTLFAVNSRGDISRWSWLSTTSHTRFVGWARTWSAGHAAAICGLDPGAANCRS
jgi:hypothetical protein